MHCARAPPQGPEADGDERIAAVLSDGRLAVLRCVEEDLWEETLQVFGGMGCQVVF